MPWIGYTDTDAIGDEHQPYTVLVEVPSQEYMFVNKL